ncbi:ParB N-terminal domain-containing protein, partial [Arthrospira platensis SPKY2]
MFRADQNLSSTMTEWIATDQLSLSERRPAGQLLADSPRVRRRLQDHGFSEPVPVRPLSGGGGFEVLGQVRQYLAAVRLGLSQVPVVVLHDLDDRAALQLIQANYTLHFDDPIDEAEFYAEKLADAPSDVRTSIS